MEEVYLRDLKSYSVSEVMRFRDKFLELINKLAQEEENIDEDPNDPLYLERKKLCRLSTEKKMRKQSQKAADKSSNMKRKSKSRSKNMPPLLPVHIPDDFRKTRKRKHDLVPHKDVAFVFKVYPPFMYEYNIRNSKPKHNLEIVVLGHQTLDKLCDKIVCDESFMEIGGDISDTPDIPVQPRLGEKYKSRMLYIGNNFYIDRSDPGNIDYSECIRRWGVRNGLNFGATLNMNEHSCLDLVCRIGYPYVYQHLGGCEHIIKLEYVRLIEEKDCLESELYPFYSYVSRYSGSKLCMACMEISEWIVFDSNRMISNPSYLCNSCFRSYHYVDGKKVSTFKAVRYWDCPLFTKMTGKTFEHYATAVVKQEKLD
ncbi:snRNA-activating protein complex subunit 3 [Planococcus citri]|uniref:snRNA-activating protein complex subunit 3 n=1 Tax=Planococcus citri TaxID=170843 RepID=UPI0031F8B817